jgi:hypothetical protein
MVRRNFQIVCCKICRGVSFHLERIASMMHIRSSSLLPRRSSRLVLWILNLHCKRPFILWLQFQNFQNAFFIQSPSAPCPVHFCCGNKQHRHLWNFNHRERVDRWNRLQGNDRCLCTRRKFILQSFLPSTPLTSPSHRQQNKETSAPSPVLRSSLPSQT